MGLQPARLLPTWDKDSFCLTEDSEEEEEKEEEEEEVEEVEADSSLEMFKRFQSIGLHCLQP